MSSDPLRSLYKNLHKHGLADMVKPKAGAGMLTGTWVEPGQPPPSSEDLCSMVRMRMRWGPNKPEHITFMAAHKLNDEKAALFVVVNGQPAMIEDEWGLFPSDALITKLRMLGS